MIVHGNNFDQKDNKILPLRRESKPNMPYLKTRCYGFQSLSIARVTFLPAQIRFLIALSHIHVSAAYRSRIYENFDTPRSKRYFARATYVPRTCDVPVAFPWLIRCVSVFVWNFTFVCTAYHGV